MRLTFKVTIISMLLLAASAGLPVVAAVPSSEAAFSSAAATSGVAQPRRRMRRNRHSGRWYGYRNYGQYRRTQVGNRRYRLARRVYWRDGVRVVRFVRVYY